MNLAVVATHTVDVVVFLGEHKELFIVPGDLEAQLLSQCIRFLEGNHRPLAVGVVVLFVHVDVAGILCPLLAVEIAKAFWHKDAEVIRQAGESVLSQCGYLIG